MRIANESLIDAPVSMASNFILEPVYLGSIINYSIQLVFTGTPGGNFKLQCSVDPGRPTANSKEPQSDTVINWTDVADSAQSISAAGNHVWDVQNCGYTWVRVVWTQTSSTGSLDVARFQTKGV
jgi:hypothetical protein